MKLALVAVSAAVTLIAGLSGCGDDDDDGVPPVEATPSADVLSAPELTCKNEIVRQMKDPSQETQEVPPECEGFSEDRLFELIQIAEAEIG